jgi:hypothetical protein
VNVLDPTSTPLPGNIPPVSDSDPFGPVDTGVAVDTLYANSGIISLKNRTELPITGGPSPQVRKLTHFRAPGMGDAMWSGACVYDIAGVSPAFSEYDQPSPYADDDGMTYSFTGGVVRAQDQVPVGEPTTTRAPRMSALYDSAPAAATFQGYWNPHWSGILSGYRPNIQPRPLHSNFNPGQMGTKELHKSTQYQPVPPMGSLVGYFGSSDKAL